MKSVLGVSLAIAILLNKEFTRIAAHASPSAAAQVTSITAVD